MAKGQVSPMHGGTKDTATIRFLKANLISLNLILPLVLKRVFIVCVHLVGLNGVVLEHVKISPSTHARL